MKPAKLDMTTGSILPLTFKFALPIIAGNILQQFYSIVDSIVAGRFCGSTSLAAVGTSAQPVEVLLCIFMGIGGGVGILVSQATGRRDIQQIKALIKTAVFFLYVTAVPLTFLGILTGPYILHLMQVPDDTLLLASTYLGVAFLGTLATMGYNMNAGILRGMGDSQASLIFLIISSFTNIAGDLFFVIVFKLGVFGIALATSISQYISWIISVLYIKKKYSELEFSFFPHGMEKDVLKLILSKGLPLGLNHSLYSFGHLVMQAIINTQGSVFIAGCSVATKITGIANLSIQAISQACSTFAGQNLGAQKYSRIKTGGRLLPFVSALITFSTGIIFTFLCRPLLTIFTNDKEVLEIAVRYICVVLPFTCTYALFNAIINIANGLGDVKYSTIVNILLLWAVRIPAGFLLNAAGLGSYVMASISISFVFGMICMLFYYRTKRWKEICRLAINEQNN
jgi:putative MATE family efflux protein